jgi:hypothetical protein
MTSRNVLRAAVITGITSLFLLWHAPLLTPAGRIRGFDSDAAILALMGKKILDGRGFDVFFWGQNYMGPLTSMLTAAWGALLGVVDPLALRLGVFVEVLAGTLLIWWGVDRIDPRAAVFTAIALALTPPVVLGMMINPLGAEMAFLLSAALFAVFMQHLTAPAGRGWLSRRAGQFAFGVLTGFSWWMNQQVVFVLLAGGAVIAARSAIGSRFWRALRLRDRVLVRQHVPGLIEAFAVVCMAMGGLLLVAYVVGGVVGAPTIPFVFGRVTDALILIAIAQIVVAVAGHEWREWRLELAAGEKREIAAIATFGAGVLAGYTPVWLGAILGWYERGYMFGFQPIDPNELIAKLRSFTAMLPHWAGISGNPIGAAYVIVLGLLIVNAFAHARSPARRFVALIPLANAAWYVLTRGVKPHYLITSAGMLLALAALGALDWWDSKRMLVRVAIAGAAIVAFLSIAMSSLAMQREALRESDPMPLLQRVRDARCAVVYSEFWVAYRYRFLDGERRAWIPYLSLNTKPGPDRTRAESFADQRLPGQRCLIQNDGSVVRIDRDLPLVHKVGRSAIPPARPSVSLPPDRRPEAR